MSGATTAALITAAAAVGTTAYSARQQSKLQDRNEKAAKMAAAKSQTQIGDPIQSFTRRRKTTQGFDALAAMPTVAGAPGAGGALFGS